MRLTKKKKAFAEARAKGLSQAAAAKMAGYSESSAKQAGYRLQRDPDIVKYLSMTTAKQIKTEETPNAPEKKESDDPIAVLKSIMNNEKVSDRDRIEAAKQVALFTLGNPKGLQGGKKEQQHKKAVESQSVFSPAPAPLKAIK